MTTINMKNAKQFINSTLSKAKGWFTGNKKKGPETFRIKAPAVIPARVYRHRLEGIAKMAWYGKAQLRMDVRANRKCRNPPKETNTVFYDTGKKHTYAMWTDGSIRKVLIVGKRRLIPV